MPFSLIDEQTLRFNRRSTTQSLPKISALKEPAFVLICAGFKGQIFSVLNSELVCDISRSIWSKNETKVKYVYLITISNGQMAADHAGNIFPISFDMLAFS